MSDLNEPVSITELTGPAAEPYDPSATAMARLDLAERRLERLAMLRLLQKGFAIIVAAGVIAVSSRSGAVGSAFAVVAIPLVVAFWLTEAHFLRAEWVTAACRAVMQESAEPVPLDWTIHRLKREIYTWQRSVTAWSVLRVYGGVIFVLLVLATNLGSIV